MFPFGKDVLMPVEASVQEKLRMLNFFCLGKLLVVDLGSGTSCSTSGKGEN
jgi:hypothetical protein